MVFRKKDNQVCDFLTRHNRLSGEKKPGNIDFFLKTAFFVFFAFAKEILEEPSILLVSETPKRGNVV